MVGRDDRGSRTLGDLCQRCRDERAILEEPSSPQPQEQLEANNPPPLSFIIDVWRSAVGFLFWVIVLTTWITIFQIYRPRWGALGDYLSFTIPLGTP